MKNQNGNELFLKFIIGLVIVVIVVLVIMNISKNNNSKKDLANTEQEESTQQNLEQEEFVQQTDDGTKVNVGSKITDEKNVNGFKFTNIQLTEKDNQSTLLADVENDTGKDISDYTNLDITFLTESGEEIITIKGILAPVKAGETTQLNAGLIQDVANAYDVRIKVTK